MTAMIVTPPFFRFKPPHDKRPSIFLAGSIEMGAAELWQDRATARLSDQASVIYNPRRADWDSSWKQDITEENFNVQVNWELDMISRSDLVMFYFDPNTKSAITLMELGFCASAKPNRSFVCCPNGFWRKGNVDIITERFGVATFADMESLISGVRLAAHHFPSIG